MSTTPVTRNPKSLRRRPGNCVPSPLVTSTPNPSTPSSTETSPAVADDDDFDRLRRFRLQDEEDEEEFYALSQYQPRKDGQVYWNYDGSPSLKAALQRKLDEVEKISPSEVVEFKPKKKPVLKIGRKKKETDPEENEKMIQSIEELLQEITQKQGKVKEQEQNEEEEDGVKPIESSTEEKKDDPFGDSEDDSFLLKCSQAVDEKFTKSEIVSEVKTNAEDPFDDGDDSFDLLMSQVDDRMLTKTNPVPNPLPPRPNQPPHILTSQYNAVKRFNSAGNTTIKPVNGFKYSSSKFDRTHSSPNTPSQNIIGSKIGNQNRNSKFDRTHTSPDAVGQKPTGRRCGSGSQSGVRTNNPRCTQDEIEKKRMEALRKRRLRQEELVNKRKS